METNGQRVYGFWDGDFTFHHVEYPDPEFNYTFRVRIDNESPEERATENERNLNGAAPGWRQVRPATQPEIYLWLDVFKRSYPLRSGGASAALRHLALHGASRASDLSTKLQAEMLRLTFAHTVVRDFKPERVTLVEIVDDEFRLTDDGRWLVALMK